MIKSIVVSAIIVLSLAGAGWFVFQKSNIVPPPQNIPPQISEIPIGKVCDKDTLTCFDGSIVSRVAPNCDFAPCPTNSASSSANTDGSVSISGEMICLPHNNTSGSQTMECALGLKGDDGNNYSLSDPTWKYLMGVGTGVSITVEGKLTKKDDPKYDSRGVIEIQKLVKN